LGRPRSGQFAARSLLRDTEEINRLSARLAYLCHLIRQDRQPFCPLNGLLVFLPWAALTTESVAQHLGRIARRELEVVQRLSQVQCPLFTLVCDLEAELGFQELVARLPAAQRQFRLGLGFPLAPDVVAKDVPRMIEGSIQWICNTQIPTLMYKLFTTDPEDGSSAEVLTGNIRMYQFFYSLRESRARLARLLSHGLYQPTYPLGGCFLAATGTETAGEQAFVSGVFPLLIQGQNAVSWTPERVIEDTTYHRWTVVGYLGLGALALVLILLLWLL
jgi:hypothetical protein